MRHMALLLLCAVLTSCESIEDIVDPPPAAVDTIESGNFDRLWDTARFVLGRHFRIEAEDRAAGRIRARGLPSSSYSDGRRRNYYSDQTHVVVEVRITTQPPTHMLSVRAAQESESFGPNAFKRYGYSDRSAGDPTPALMAAPQLERRILFEIRKELQAPE